MNWSQFKQYLEEKIFEEDSESESDSDKFLIKDEVKTKYSLDEKNTEKLLNAIINLTNSIENYNSEDYHSLPEFSATEIGLDGEEKEVSKSWKQFFPDRRKVFFGSNDNSETIDASTFAVFEAIYTDFIRPTKLAESFSEGQLIKLVAGSAINLTYEAIKSKGIDKMLEQWLADYAKLSEEERQTLKKQQSLVSQLSGLIKEEEQHRQQQSWSWLPNWPWKDIVYYGGGGLLIIVVVGWLWKKDKK